MPAVPLRIERLPEALQEEMQKSLSTQTQLFNLVNAEVQKLQAELAAVKRERDTLRQANAALTAQLKEASEDKTRGAPPTAGCLALMFKIRLPWNTSEKFALEKYFPNHHKAPVHSVAMSDDSTRFVTASWDATMHVFDLTRKELDKTLRKQNAAKSEQMGGLYSVAFAKTAPEVLGCTSVDRHVYLWNHVTGQQISKLGGDKGHQELPPSIPRTPRILRERGQQVMATASDDSNAIIWDFAEGIPLRTLKHPEKPVYGVTFLGKDGRPLDPERQYFVATCCFDQRTRIFDMRDKKVVTTLDGHTDDIIGIDYATQGLLATGSDDGCSSSANILIYDTKTWKLLHRLECKVDLSAETEVKRVAFSRDGDMLAAACSTGTVRPGEEQWSPVGLCLARQIREILEGELGWAAMELPSAPVLGFKEALVGLKASELQKGVAERSKGPLVSDSGDSISGDAVKLAPEKQTQKRYEPQVQAINALEETMKAKSDDQLRALTADLQQRAQSGTPLEELLPEAFALVREGSTRVLGLRHFDVQLMGGIALHEGNIAEMGTGEGKTLVAILAAFLNALSGKGVHVVTVNDYLARRDAEWVGQPLRFLGMTVGVVQNGMPPDQKKKAYRNDVTYVTNSELGFDYLRDQMAPSPSELALREQTPFNFAVVDEVDSILIDEARTPLIISGVADNTPTKYKVAQEVVRALKPEVHYTVDEKQRQCVLIEANLDPWFPFVTNALNAKELYIKDKAYIVKRGEVMIVDEFTGRVMEGRRWSNGLHQAIEAKENVQIQAESVTLASISYQSLFRLFDKLSGMTGTAFTEAKEFEEVYKLKTVVVPPNLVRKRADKDDQVYVDDIGKWKAVAREVENAHRIGRPVLIGTTNVENSEIIAELLDALGVAYQLLNAKPENVARETEIVASSGRKYAVTIATNMAGRGTDILLGGNPSMMARLRLREDRAKLFPKKSWAMPEEFYPVDLTPELEQQVSNAVSQTVEAWKPKETDLKPTSLEAAEQIVSQGKLSELDAEERLSLACEKAPTEDEVILQLREAYKALAAHYKQITDLEKDEVRALGGLLVLGTERHESRRIDNQLRGRCARQGDPGATRFFLSLNDTIFRIFGGDNIKKMMSMMSLSQRDDVPLESGLLSNSLEEAQKKHALVAMLWAWGLWNFCVTVWVFVLCSFLFKVLTLYLFGPGAMTPISPDVEELPEDRGAARPALQALRRGDFAQAFLKDADAAALQKRLESAIGFLQEAVLLPIDKRLPGRPFEFDMAVFPCKPTVLMIGNHSSGKSTFINRMMGVQVQETGVAPTDDGFTILERSEEHEQFEDGPTLTGCSENKAFRELQRFGRSFLGHCRRKRMVLPKDAELPYGLQLVDTPGMIDLPGNNQTSSKARGYNFVEVVRWWAKRSDLILLLFDPDKPGTTGETLEVLTKSLAGLDHKFLVVLNKAFAANRNAVVREVLRAKVRHWDNIVTSLEECLRQSDMLSRMCNKVRESAKQQISRAWRGAALMLSLPFFVAAFIGHGRFSGGLATAWSQGSGVVSLLSQLAVLCVLLCFVVLGLTLDQLRQFDRIQMSHGGLDTMFESVYHDIFIHTGGEDLRVRWATVRPLLEAMLKSVKSPTQLPLIESWELDRIAEILEEDIWYLRQVAKRLRPAEPKMPEGHPPRGVAPTEPVAAVGRPEAKRREGREAREANQAAQAAQAVEAGVAEVYSAGMPQAVELVRLGVESDRQQMSFSKLGFLEIAASGDANVAAAVGKRYLLGIDGFAQDFSRAKTFLHTAIQQQHPGARGLLGYMYSLGLGVHKDLDRAYAYFQNAAAQDDPLGHNGLGYIYFQGTEKIPQNLTLAFDHFNRSAQRGNADGMFNLASVYLTGSGVQQSFQKATQWDSRGADIAHPEVLAVMHLNGIGTVRNCKMAVELLKRVCERGSWVSNKLLGKAGEAELRPRCRGDPVTAVDRRRAEERCERCTLAYSRVGHESLAECTTVGELEDYVADLEARERLLAGYTGVEERQREGLVGAEAETQ
eukprot:g285.t1